MVALINPFVPLPNEKQRHALEIASDYLKRASSHAATRMLVLHADHPQLIDLGEMCDSLDRAAVLLQGMSEVEDGWAPADD